MAQPNRNARQWKFLDIFTAMFFSLVLLFFLLVFTPFGDPLAYSGRQALLLSTSDPKQRHRFVSLVELGEHRQPIDPCPPDSVDHMPCEDPKRNSQLSRYMNFYRERHCPLPDEMPLCLIPPPLDYKIPIQWPESLHKVWHSNMPHNKIATRKGHQGWMKEEGPYFIFPGGGTMFPDGALPYIDKLRRFMPIKGGIIRAALDMGCGVASFGGSLLAEGILTLSFAPRDSHKAQIQFALERGIPAFVLMFGTRRLPFPAFAFDFIHCSRCLIPFAAYNATYFIEVDRLLRPGGFLVISGPPVQWPKKEREWEELQAVARALCYELIIVEGNTVIWKKPDRDPCLKPNEFRIGLCDESDDPNNIMNNGIDLFQADTRRWATRVAYYKNTLKVKLGTPAIRNVMDMNAFFGGFAAALETDPVWVMNVVPARKPLTLDIIYDRGLIGVYHDWCEPFSTYPRTYDLIHVASIDSLTRLPGSRNSSCSLVDLMAEIDRMLRPEGTAVIQDSPEVIKKVARIAHVLRWVTTINNKEPESHGRGKILVATKTFWHL
ncbi:hypothetical protein ES332_D08G169000v1 [Gossypium tomentosum]|uniref:Methyltransferase n=1 Tax=Gossypium tomentosum TaxID=34277 RepID=A0A5D2JVJ6_GOSTO|nr:hypothetical protein ES332_D08G169000v1 [Gossypium tomentosum]